MAGLVDGKGRALPPRLHDKTLLDEYVTAVAPAVTEAVMNAFNGVAGDQVAVVPQVIAQTSFDVAYALLAERARRAAGGLN